MRNALSAITLFCVGAATLCAQEYRGTISGGVTDAQGAAVARSKVSARETRTGVKSETISELSGAYNLPFLLPGEYEIVVEAVGFKTAVRRGVNISMGDHPVIDVRLEVGDVTQSVMVTSEAPLIDAANSAIGQVISARDVENLPVNGRVPLMLAHLALGVTSTYEPGPVRPYDNNGQNQTSMGGTPSGTSETLMNGAPNAGFFNQAAYSPPNEAVLEVRVNTFDTDAAYGHSMGGTTNQITKGGNNSFHGSIYDFNQVSVLTANNFFYNKGNIARPVYQQNQYGITAGGPVWLPKIVDSRNRVFWFFAFEGLKSVIPQTSGNNPAYYATVPTPAERQGDFSALLRLNRPGSDYTIYDPNTGVMSGAQVARTPFPNNVLPQTRLNRVALNYLKYYPQPNNSVRADGFQNYTINAVNVDHFDNELGRLDFNISNHNKLYFDFRQNYRNFHGTQYLGDNNPASGQISPRTNWGSTLDDVHTFSPTMVGNLRLNWTRYIESGGNPSDGMNPADLGFPAYIAASSQRLTMPGILFGSAGISGGSQSSFQSLGARTNYGTSDIADSFQLFADVVKIRGNHSIKTGVDIREYRWSNTSYGDSSGNYIFNQRWTNGPLGNAAASPLGQDFAAFLLGLPSSGTFDVKGQSTTASRYYAIFVQEDWRVRSNLTLNLGLRWEHETPATERFNRAVNGFDPKATNAVSAAAAAAYAQNPIPEIAASQFRALGGLTFAGPGNRDIYQTNSSIFSPRAGFAWSPKVLGTKTVIRGGVGVFVAPIGIVGNASIGFNYKNGANGLPALRQEGFSQTTQFVATNNNFLSPANSLSDPFPTGILQPVGSSQGASTFLGQQIQFFSPEVRNPYCLRWNFGIQRQLPGQIILEVAYIGNHGVHLLVATTNMDFVPARYLSTSPLRDQAVINSLTATVPNPFRGLLPNSTALNGATVARQQLLIPYPQFPVAGLGGVVNELTNNGSTYYQSLNVRLQKRFSNGVTLMNNFVWNKMMDRLAYLNDSDPAPEKRTSIDSRPLREVFAGTYRLPFGHGMRFDFHNRVENAILGRWAMNGILTLQSGPQYAWGNLIYYGGSLQSNPHEVDAPAFDTSRFNTLAAQQLANNIRTFNSVFNNLRRDPTRNLDVSLSKEVPFAERKYLQLRFESFNTLNRVTMAAPNLTATASTFGLITGQVNTPRRIQIGARLVW